MNIKQKIFFSLISIILLSATALAASAPHANFSASPTSGKAPLTVDFADKSTGTPDSWYWIFGDGTSSTAKNPVHIYTKTGKYDVTLKVKNAAGSDTKTVRNYINVQPALKAPHADFTAFPPAGRAPLTVNFKDKSTGSPDSYYWTFGDGTNSTAKNPVHIYTKAGKYNITLIVKNAAGSDTKTLRNHITVLPPKLPHADFIASPTSGKASLTVNFSDKSTGSPYSWYWTFGDGTNSTAKNPVHIYTKEGRYTVTLTVKNVAGKDQVTKHNYIIVTPLKPPHADFIASPTSGKAPLTVNFADKSTGSPDSYYWVFGDGTSSTAKNPVHIYTKAGKYDVTLIVRNSAGYDTKTVDNYIKVNK